MSTLDGNAGVVTFESDVVGEVRDFSVTTNAETKDDTAMGDVWRTHKVGFKTWQANVTCWFDDADAAQIAAVEGASLTCLFQPEGTDTGDYLLTGTGTIADVGLTQSMDGIVEKTFSITGNGALTVSTVGA